MLPLFQDNFILGEATSSHFFRVTTSTQQLLFRDSYFFRTAAFFPFFRTVNFSQELFFQNSFFFGANLLQSRHVLRISVKKFFTDITFRNSYFIWRNCSGERYLKKQLIFQSRYFYTVLTFSEKIDFGKS